jgi:hypothetical protein
MVTTKGSIVGREVYDKRAGMMGKVLKEDGLSLVIEFSTPDGTTTKTITPSTFKRWYRLLDPEPAEENVPEAQEQETKEVRGSVPEEHKGAVGAGSALCKLFLATVRSSANQDLEITGTKDKRNVVVKYNGKNVFEITVCKRRLVVMCHPKSLAPSNVAQLAKQYPKEFGWALRAKFVFTDDAQLPLMRSIINDGLYYRQIVEREQDS